MSDHDNSVENIWTISNIITILRIILVPVFVAALLAPWPEWFGSAAASANDWKSIVAAVIFVFISCTDWLDGYLARSRGEITDFGKFMDPLADKILVSAALISLVELGALPTWVVLIILTREFIVSGVRMMAATKDTIIAASKLGKIKTVFQMIAIILFTIKDSHMVGSFNDALSDVLWDISWAFMLTALGLTIVSMLDYLVKARMLFTVNKSQDSNINSIDIVPTNKVLLKLASEIISLARDKNVTLATAESLTGGMIGAFLTSVPGSSEVFLGSVVSYTNKIKHELLGVDETILQTESAICECVVREMAEGVRNSMSADLAIAVTGIAGPQSDSSGKPVGTVWVSKSNLNGTSAEVKHFKGNRSEIRHLTTQTALNELKKALLQYE